MPVEDSGEGRSEMARRAREAWEAKAAFWDEMVGEGNVF